MTKKEKTQEELRAEELLDWQLRVRGLARLIETCEEVVGTVEEDWVWVDAPKEYNPELKFYGCKFCSPKNKNPEHAGKWYLPSPRWLGK